MRRWLTVAVVGLLLATTAGCGSDEPAKPATKTTNTAAVAKAKAAAGIEDCPQTRKNAGATKSQLPELTLDCLGGGRDVQLGAVADRATVLNLWASWCGPCRKEMPLFQKLHESEPAVQVLGIDFGDDSVEAALGFAQRAGVTFAQMADPKRSVAEPLKVVGLPQTVFVDKSGRIVATERRAFTSYEDLLSAVDKHLGGMS